MEEVKEDGEVQEEWQVLQQVSEEAVRVAGEAIQGVYSGSPKIPPGHRRCRSEVVATVQRSNSFQKLKSSVQRALWWGRTSQEETFFNPEILANQKRQWYQFHSRDSDFIKYEEPTSLFEHFVIAGIHPDANLEVVGNEYSERKKLEFQVEKSSLSAVEPQILFKYPPGKRVAMRLKDLAAFCFPGGVKARVLERTPSLSELNELVYGQEHLTRDNLSFLFSVKVGDNATLYGLCLHVEEFVQSSQTIFGGGSPLSQPSKENSRFLISAPRCYCLLTRVPFFELHYEMLNSIIAQERLNRITQFVSEITPTNHVASESKSNDEMKASGIASEGGLRSSPSRWDPHSPSASEDSSHSQSKDMEKERGNDLQNSDEYTSDASGKHLCMDRMYGSCDNSQMPEVETDPSPGRRTLERLESCDSLISSVRSTGSEDEDDEIFSSSDKDAGAETAVEWARNQKDLLQIVCSYQAMPLPSRGSQILFKPLEHLQPIKYRRSPVSALGIHEGNQDLEEHHSYKTAEVNLKLAAAEGAVALSSWTTATICRVLSLENILTLVTGVLLEKQVVVICPNLGVLSAMVLSLIPMIRPFEWQSLFLPVLPGKMFDFLDAPVPFVAGIQLQLPDLKMKTSNLVQVNVDKDEVKLCSLPALPRYKELLTELRPIHAILAREKSIAKRRPVYKCNEVQAVAAGQYSSIMRRYLESLCSNLSSHTITSVQSNDDRVSILLKDSFVDSFPSKDQPFIKLFVDTQMFTVLSDSRLSRYEHGYN